MFKRLNIFSVVLAAMPLLSSNALAVKVGTVDLNKALQESKRGKNAKSNLDKEVEDKKKKITSEQDSIRKLSEEFQKKSLVMSEKARTEKGMEIQQRMGAWQELVQKSEGEIQERHAELTRPILDGLRGMIGELAKKKSLEVVHEVNSGLLYAADRVDLTEELIKAYDEKNPK